MSASTLPTLNELGRDLLHIPHWRLIVSLTAPFALVGGYFASAFSGCWGLAVGCVIALSFVTYGSVSHDLVHRSLGLPRRLNDLLLTAIELLLFRSGRAYRLAHLNHHARYPELHNDPESQAAYGTFWAALRSGPLFFIRLWFWAIRCYPAHRVRLIAEVAAILVLGLCAVIVALIGWSVVPLVYMVLAYLGTWVVPLATAFIPHTPHGDSPLSRTRRFRGRLTRLVALDHLYHLEHHLYPAVPHHKWAELAHRLDPYFDRIGIPSVRLGF
jgi:beta-carotene hydroxylase